MTSAKTSQRWAQRIPFILVPVLALIALLSWGFASSVGSSPDEDFHLVSIWCGHGDSEVCGFSSTNKHIVYRDLIEAPCNAFYPDQSAACLGEDFGRNPDNTVVTDRGNAEGLYPPVYYFVMSLFASPDIETSVLIMRAVNAVLFVGLISLLFWLLPLHRRQTLVWSLAVTLIPLGMWLIPSINPTSWAILSAAVLWLSLLGMFESSGWRRIALGCLSLLSVLIGAGARADSALYAGLIVVLVLVLVARKRRELLRPTLFALGLAVIAGLFVLSAGQRTAVTQGLVEQGATNPATLLTNLVDIPAIWLGIYGFQFGLGWLDTAMPITVSISGIVVLWSVVFLGLATPVARKLAASGILFAVLLLYPTYLLYQSGSVVGQNFQPRYILPLMIVLAGLLLLQTPQSPLVVTRLQVGVVVTVLSLANARALYRELRRSLTGLDGTQISLDMEVEWWWQVPFSPMAVWIIGSLAFAGVMVLIASRSFNLPRGSETGAVILTRSRRYYSSPAG